MKFLRRSLLPSWSALLASASVALASTAISPDELAMLTSIEQLSLSPDGRRVAYVVGCESTRNGGDVRELWIIDSAGGVPQRLVPAIDTVTDFQWSKDGRQLALLVNVERPRHRQLWLLDPNSGQETVLLPDVAGASDLQWAPNGQALTFLWRGPATAVKAAPNSPARLGQPGEPTLIWECNVGSHAVRALTAKAASVGRYAWSPSGNAIVAAVHPAAAWLSPTDDIIVQPVDPAQPPANPRKLFTAHDQTIALSWSPDAKTIAWCGREHEPDSGQLMVAPADGSSPPRTVYADFPGSVEWLGHRSDGKIVFAAVVGLRVGLYSLAADGTGLKTEQDPAALSPGSIGSGSFTTLCVSFSADGRRFATTVSGPHEPGNLAIGTWGEKLQRITAMNPQVAKWELGTVEDVAWHGSDGLELQGLLLKPPGFDPSKKYPLVVEVHGGPRRSWWATSLLTDNTWGAYLATRGYLVLMPNPRGSEGRGAAFVRMNTNDFGGGDMRDVLAGADHVIGLGFVDPTRTAIAGWSYGGYLTAWTITQTSRFKAAVVGAGITNWMSREGTSTVPGMWGRLHWLDARVIWNRPQDVMAQSPISFAKNVHTPTLLFYGGSDSKVPAHQGVEFYNALRSYGTPVEAYVYPGEGHQFTDPAHKADLLKKIEAWFAEYLRAGD